MSLLARVPLFSGLRESEIALLEQRAVPRSFPRNTIILSEGDETDAMYVVVSGHLRVYCCNEQGKEITLNDLRDGDWFGEIALLDTSERSASVISLTPARCLMISAASFREVLAQSPDLALNLIRSLSERVRALTGSVKSLALLDVYGRVAHTLLEVAGAAPKDGTYDTVLPATASIPLTQQDIANRVGASREMVARILKDLERGGYIETHNRRITIREKLPARY